jgi:phospholipase C
MNRRKFLQLAGTAGFGLALSPLRRRMARAALPPLPCPSVDTMPEIEHFVLLIMENHSFDNVLGTLDRPGVDGLTFVDGVAQNSNPDSDGNPVTAFHLPTTCQDGYHVGQSWNSSHLQWNGGANDGFVKTSGRESMGYYTAADLPVMHALAATFPVCDRWFCSTMCQTYPNRMFTFAGTCQGAIATDTAERIAASPPAAGLIFDSLDRAGVSWKNYAVDLGDTMLWGPAYFATKVALGGHFFPIADFFADAALGTLPAFSVITPDGFEASEENPQNVEAGETFVWSIVTALFASPAWSKTALLITYDEHGGYYDHVPPAALPAPGDGILPRATQLFGDAYTFSGFRVPTILVSPWARAGTVSHTIYDHTSIMAFLERKYGLAALTDRDAAAADMTDLFDFSVPSFANPPLLPPPPLLPSELACVQNGQTGIATP